MSCRENRIPLLFEPSDRHLRHCPLLQDQMHQASGNLQRLPDRLLHNTCPGPLRWYREAGRQAPTFCRRHE